MDKCIFKKVYSIILSTDWVFYKCLRQYFLKEKKITLDGSIKPHKWTNFSLKDTVNIMCEGHH